LERIRHGIGSLGRYPLPLYPSTSQEINHLVLDLVHFLRPMVPPKAHPSTRRWFVLLLC
jgi:hypothetical protein